MEIKDVNSLYWKKVRRVNLLKMDIKSLKIEWFFNYEEKKCIFYKKLLTLQKNFLVKMQKFDLMILEK